MFNISPSYITLVVVVIVSLANLFRVKIDEQALTTLITEIIPIIGSIYVIYRKVFIGKEINIFGKYKKVE